MKQRLKDNRKNQTKNWLFGKIKLVRHQSIHQEKKKSAQINKSEMKEKFHFNTTEIQRVIRDYYKQLYVNKMNNLEEIEKFLERYNLLRLNQEET